MTTLSRISLIAAIGKNRELGLGDKLLWRLPEDMRRFKEITTAHPVIMGRKTWESIPQMYRPLPDRTNIVVTHQAGYVANGAVVVASLEEARAAAARALGADEVFIIGGGEIYKEALPFTDRLYLTIVDAVTEADTFFPAYEKDFTKIISDESGESNGLKYRWVTLERRPA